MTKKYTKISDTEFKVTETKEITSETTINLDQLENEKLQLLTSINNQVASMRARVTEIDEQIVSLKDKGAKTYVEVENERQAQQEADREAQLLAEQSKIEE